MKNANVQGPLFSVQCLRFIVQCSCFFKAFLVVVFSLLNANAVLGVCPFGVGGVKANGPSGVDGGVVIG